MTEVNKKYKTYLFHYYHKGRCLSLDISGESQEDAQLQIDRISDVAKYDGVLVQTIQVRPGVGIYVRIVTWLKNMLRFS